MRRHALPSDQVNLERLFIDNLLVRVQFIIEMIWWTGLAPRVFEFTFPGGLLSTFLEVNQYQCAATAFHRTRCPVNLNQVPLRQVPRNA